MATALPAAPMLMGILNLTPDSFSDGGRFSHLPLSAMVDAAAQLLADGADILDIGGESTRPGAQTVSESEEIDRILPAITAIHKAFPQARLSVDTRKAAVARAAVDAGATMINDISGLRYDPAMAPFAAATGVDLVIMHSRGEPRTMQDCPQYDNVLAEVSVLLTQQADVAMAAGVARERVWLDPGFGFGKTRAHNLALLDGLPSLVALGFPVLVGLSRKTFLSPIDTEGRPTLSPGERDGLSLAAGTLALHAGATMLRVHDVKLHHPVVLWLEALRG